MTESIPAPDPDLQTLAPLIGTWRLSGDSSGTVRYEWFAGGYFIVQHVDMQLFGDQVTAIELIGHLRPFGEQPDPEIRSRAYDSMGHTLDYVYDITDGVLTIFAGERGSEAYYRARFSEDGNSATGAWTYPGGGGYTSNMTRVE